MKNANHLLISLFFIFFLPTVAYAYIDPGSISFLLQGIVATIFGVWFAFRQTIARFFGAFFKRRPKS